MSGNNKEELVQKEEDSLSSEEIFLTSTKEPSRFDAIIGCIEDIVIEDDFQELQGQLLASNYSHFDENTEENKLIYTDIFQRYTSAVESFIESELKKRVVDFNMKEFIDEFEEKKTDLEGEVFDMLYTLTDFLAFKEMFIDYKMMRDAGAIEDMTVAISSLQL